MISIGFVAENEQTFYAELSDYDKSQLNPWLEENVIAHLECSKNVEAQSNMPDYHYGIKEEIRASLTDWFLELGDEVQLVADVGHFDMVLLIDIFGNAFEMPANVGASCYDINQDIAKYYNITPQQAFNKSREEIAKEFGANITGDKHNALYDAKVCKAIAESLLN